MQMLLLTLMFMAIPMFLILFFPILSAAYIFRYIDRRVYYLEKQNAFICMILIYLLVLNFCLLANIVVIPAMLISGPLLLAYLIYT